MHVVQFPLMNKEERLKKLQAELAQAQLPLMESNLVFGEGNIDCEVLFIGEAPGKTEDELKRPFVGRAGQLVNKLLTEIGWKREDVYITNIVKRRPPENRDPLPEVFVLNFGSYQPLEKYQRQDGHF